MLAVGCSKSQFFQSQSAATSTFATILPTNPSAAEEAFVKTVETVFSTTNTEKFADMFCWNGIDADETVRKIYFKGDDSIMSMWSHKMELKRVDPSFEIEEVEGDGTKTRANMLVKWRLVAYLSNGGASYYLIGETNGVLMFAVSKSLSNAK
jgi:hypothetical protein